jgi:hypothetical protein
MYWPAPELGHPLIVSCVCEMRAALRRDASRPDYRRLISSAGHLLATISEATQLDYAVMFSSVVVSAPCSPENDRSCGLSSQA